MKFSVFVGLFAAALVAAAPTPAGDVGLEVLGYKREPAGDVGLEVLGYKREPSDEAQPYKRSADAATAANEKRHDC